MPQANSVERPNSVHRANALQRPNLIQRLVRAVITLIFLYTIAMVFPWRSSLPMHVVSVLLIIGGIVGVARAASPVMRRVPRWGHALLWLIAALPIGLLLRTLYVHWQLVRLH